MAVFTTGTLQLPNEMAGALISKVRDESVVAKLAPASAGTTILNDQYTLVTTEPEFEAVAESGEKSQSDFATAPKITGNVKFAATLRFSQEVLWADDDTQLEVLTGATDSLAAAASRALDYGIIHGVSPKTGSAITGVTALATAATQQTATSPADPVTDIDTMPDAIIGNHWNVTGLALAPSYALAMRKVRNDAGARLFPDLPLDIRSTSAVEGIAAAVSGTVNGDLITPATGIKAIMGDWGLVKWGIVRQIPTKLIEYGDPDNTGRDLQGHNEVALRMEVVYKWVVIDPLGFVVLK